MSEAMWADDACFSLYIQAQAMRLYEPSDTSLTNLVSSCTSRLRFKRFNATKNFLLKTVILRVVGMQ